MKAALRGRLLRLEQAVARRAGPPEQDALTAYRVAYDDYLEGKRDTLPPVPPAPPWADPASWARGQRVSRVLAFWYRGHLPEGEFPADVVHPEERAYAIHLHDGFKEFSSQRKGFDPCPNQPP